MHIKKISTFAPVLAAVVIAACAGVSLAGYTPNVYAVTPKEAAQLENQSGDSQPETTPDAQVFDLPDGTYEGTGTGYAGKITVSVEIKDKKIVAINVLNVEADDEAFFNRAKAVIDRIIQSQSLDVDVVSGATYSSNGIISAVKNALTGEKDSGKTASADAGKGQGTTEVSQVADAAAYRDGTYYGTATGFGGPMKVKVVISGGKIESIDVVENKDDASYFNRAKTLIAKIISGQTTNVDTVSGATYSSAGIINAVRNALSQAAVSGTSSTQGTVNNSASSTSGSVTQGASGKFPYKDGVYNGTGFGYGGDISVSVVIQNKTIKAILITDAKDEDEAFFNRAKVVADNVVTAQSVNVDTVSGATYSSKGILEAIRNALAEAQKATNASGSGNSGSDNSGNGTSGSNNSSSGNGTNSGNNNNSGNTANSGNTSDSGNADTKPTTYANGTYTIIVPCVPDDDEDFEPYNLTANITIQNDRIVSVTDVSGDGDSGNDRYIKWAAEGRSNLTGMISKVLGLSREDTTEAKITSLDTVSRATCSSKSIREACIEALKKARSAFQGQ